MRKMTSIANNAAPTIAPITIPAIAPPDRPVRAGKQRAPPVLDCDNAIETVKALYVGVANVLKHGGDDVTIDDTSTAVTD